MSFREIDFAVRAIGKRQGLEYKLQAALHGFKVEVPPDENEVAIKADEDQIAKAMTAIEETLARKQREAAERGGQ